MNPLPCSLNREWFTQNYKVCFQDKCDVDKQINLDFHYFGYIVSKWRSSGRVTRKKQHLRPSQPSAVLVPVDTGDAALWNVTPCSEKICYPHH